MAQRPKFRITTTGIDLKPELDDLKLPPVVQPKSEALRQFDILVQNSGIAELLHAHTLAVNKFVDAVAKGIKKNPEQLMVDYYRPFVALLEHWAANYKVQNTPPKQFLLSGKKKRPQTRTEEEEPTQMQEEEIGAIDVLSFSGFKAKLLGERRPTELPLNEPTLLFNYLKYLFVNANYAEQYPDANNVWKDIALLSIAEPEPFSITTEGDFIMNGGQVEAPTTLLDSFTFQGSGTINLTPRTDVPPPTAQPPPQPSPPAVQPKDKLTDLLEFMFQHEAEAANASNLVEFYKYSILPKRFSNRLFGPDLVYGIGQALQSLRQTFRFRQSNDELFVDFVNDEAWRDLFVSLVVKSILLGEKYSAFNPPKGVIELLKREIESIAVRFRGFKKFNQTFPTSAPLLYNI